MHSCGRDRPPPMHRREVIHVLHTPNRLPFSSTISSYTFSHVFLYSNGGNNQDGNGGGSSEQETWDTLQILMTTIGGSVMVLTIIIILIAIVGFEVVKYRKKKYWSEFSAEQVHAPIFNTLLSYLMLCPVMLVVLCCVMLCCVMFVMHACMHVTVCFCMFSRNELF